MPTITEITSATAATINSELPILMELRKQDSSMSGRQLSVHCGDETWFCNIVAAWIGEVKEIQI